MYCSPILCCSAACMDRGYEIYRYETLYSYGQYRTVHFTFNHHNQTLDSYDHCFDRWY